MRHETRKKIIGILDCYPENSIQSQEVREQIGAQLLLEKCRSDVGEYLADSDIAYQFAKFLLTSKKEDRDTLIETMTECLMKSMSPEIDEAYDETLTEMEALSDAENGIQYGRHLDNNEIFKVGRL